MAERKFTIRMEANTANLQRGMATASASTQGFGKSIEQGITRHAAGIRMTGMAIAGLGAAITGAMVISIKEAMTFEKQLANVSTMLDDISMELMPSFASGLRNMSKEFGQSTETLSKGLYDILSASIPPAKALDVLAVSAMAAVAGLTETGITADAITTILNSYGFAAEDAAMVSDKLWAIIKEGKTTMVELAPSIGRVASIASTAGLSFDELGATIATLTRGGIKTEEAMTAVRAVMLAFLKPTDDAAEAAEEFGLKLSSNTLKTKGLREVIKLLNEASAEQLARILPNVRGLSGMATALGDATGWAESYKVMLDSAGLTEKMFQKQTEATAFTFDQLKQEFIDIGRVLGKELLPIIKSDFIPLVKNVIEYLKGWLEKFKALSPEMKKFLLVLGPILIAVGGLVALLPTLAPIIAILLGPIGLVVAAIAGLTAAFTYFYTTSEKFRNFVDKIVAYIKAFVRDAWNRLMWLKDNWGKLWKTIFEAIPKIAKDAYDNLIAIFKWVWEYIKGWGTWLFKNFLNVWKNLFSAVSTGLKNFGTNVVAQLSWLGQKMNPKNWFKKIERPDWTPLFEGLETKWEEMPKIAELQLKKIADIKVYFEPLSELIKPTIKSVKDLGKEIDKVGAVTRRTFWYVDEALKLQAKETKIVGEEWEKVTTDAQVYGTSAVKSSQLVHKGWKLQRSDIKITSEEWKKATSAEKAYGTAVKKGTVSFVANWRKRREEVNKSIDAQVKAHTDMVKKIEDEYYELTHTRKQLLDKQWKDEEKVLRDRLKGMATEEKISELVQKAKYSHYYQYTQDVKKLLDSLTKEQKKYYEKVMGITIDWGNLTEKEIENIIKEISGLEKEWKKAYDNMSDEAKDWYIEVKKYTGDFTEFTVDELKEIEEAYKSTSGRIRHNWGEAFKGFTTELWVQFKTIGLEKLGELGVVISALGAIIKGDLMVGVKSLAGSFINLLFQSEGFRKLMAVINPIIQMVADAFGMLFEPLIPIAETLRDILKPILEALGPLFRVIGEILATALVPVLKILAPIFEVVGIALLALADIIAWIVDLFGDPFLLDIIEFVRGEIEQPSSYQKGGLIPKGARGIKTEPGELVLSKPITNWLREALSTPGPMEYGVRYATDGIISGDNGKGSVTVNVPRGAVVIYGDIRTKMDVEELEETLGQKFGEEIARRVIEI